MYLLYFNHPPIPYLPQLPRIFSVKQRLLQKLIQTQLMIKPPYIPEHFSFWFPLLQFEAILTVFKNITLRKIFLAIVYIDQLLSVPQFINKFSNISIAHFIEPP